MSLPVIEYIEWITGRPAAVDYDLGSSDLRGTGDHDESRVVPPALDGLETPADAATVAECVAAAYDVTTSEVLVTAGASLANAVAAATALDAAQERLVESESREPSDTSHLDSFPDGFDPAGRVLVEKPAYEPLVDTPQLFGARVDRFRRTEDDDWRLDPDRVAAAVMEETALVTTTNRHNPTGRLADRETLRAAADAAGTVGARLLVDEVYAPYVVGGPPDAGRHAFGGVTGAGIDDTVVTGSLTKFHGLGDLQVGWLVADADFVARAERVATHFPDLAGPSRALACRAFAHRERLERDSRELLARNAALLDSFVAGRDDLAGPVYEGASYAFLDHETADGDAVTETALDRGLLVVPGRFFETPERFRLSLGRDTAHVREALDVLGTVLDDL